MNAGHWPAGLSIQLPDTNRQLIINSAQEAAALLADKWPLTYGRSYQRALAVCAAVREGSLKAEDARSALIEAAKEAGVLASRTETAAIMLSSKTAPASASRRVSGNELADRPPRHAGTRIGQPTFYA